MGGPLLLALFPVRRRIEGRQAPVQGEAFPDGGPVPVLERLGGFGGERRGALRLGLLHGLVGVEKRRAQGVGPGLLVEFVDRLKLAPKLGILGPKRLDLASERVDQLQDFGRKNHSTLDSEVRAPVSNNRSAAIDRPPSVAFRTHPGLTVALAIIFVRKPLTLQGEMVPQEGFEPPTPSLRMRCSTS